MVTFIGVILSEPYTNMAALCMCLCMLACLLVFLDQPITENINERIQKSMTTCTNFCLQDYRVGMKETVSKGNVN